MKKKILIGSIFAALLMLSTPVVSNIQAQQVKSISNGDSWSKKDCTIAAAMIVLITIVLIGVKPALRPYLEAGDIISAALLIIDAGFLATVDFGFIAGFLENCIQFSDTECPLCGN